MSYAMDFQKGLALSDVLLIVFLLWVSVPSGTSLICFVLLNVSGGADVDNVVNSLGSVVIGDFIGWVLY